MSGMNGPQWLADIVGALALLMALYALVRIAVSVRLKRPTDYAAETVRSVCGVALAGLLIPDLHLVRLGGTARVWILVAGLLTAWVALALLREVRDPDRRWRHLPSLLLGTSTVYLLSAYQGMGHMASMSPSAMGGMNMAGMNMGARIVPGSTIDLLLAFALTGSVVVLVDRLSRGAATFGAPTALSGATGPSVPEYAARGAYLASSILALSAAYLLVMYFL